MRWHLVALAVALLQTPPRQAPFQSPYPIGEMRGKQAVVETSAGSFVIQLLPDAAPNHVGLFMKLARDGAYTGTIFHRVIRYAVIQGGDPLSKDPAKVADYGQGGLDMIRAEPNAEKHTAGAISTISAPGSPDSGGSQFIISVTDQPQFDGQFTVFGRIVDGIEIAQQLSAAEADAEGRPRTRIEIKNVTIRDTPPEPFVNDTAAELNAYRALVETTLGTLGLDMMADKAPETVRSFLRMAQAGVYDGIRIHRIAPGFVVQIGALAYRDKPMTVKQADLVHNLQPEFSDTPNLPGIVAMARGDELDSATTSFFICIGECRALDGKYTVFARLAAGQDVLDKIAAVPVDGEMPRVQVDVTRIRVEKR